MLISDVRCLSPSFVQIANAASMGRHQPKLIQINDWRSGMRPNRCRCRAACLVEVYVRDKQGMRVEFFSDPSTDTPVGGDWKNPS